nr:hypothetical protein [Planctomicrobium sp.]
MSASNLNWIGIMVRYNFFWLLLVFVLPSTADAQFGVPRSRCNTCQAKRQAFVPYVAPPVVSHCPQVQTTYRQQQFTTYQPVTRTHVRREAVQVNVPVTTQKQVTVDEGGYKMVWVPKMTTKTVAQTTIQKQVQYRDVPYQVVENVPQVHTRIVPQQTIAYRPQTIAMRKPCCQSNVFSAMPTPLVSTIPPTTVAQAPIAKPVPAPQTTAKPQAENWVKVPQKNAASEKVEAPAKIELQSFEQFAPAKSAKGMFSRPSSTSTALRTSRMY